MTRVSATQSILRSRPCPECPRQTDSRRSQSEVASLPQVADRTHSLIIGEPTRHHLHLIDRQFLSSGLLPSRWSLVVCAARVTASSEVSREDGSKDRPLSRRLRRLCRPFMHAPREGRRRRRGKRGVIEYDISVACFLSHFVFRSKVGWRQLGGAHGDCSCATPPDAPPPPPPPPTSTHTLTGTLVRAHIPRTSNTRTRTSRTRGS